MHCQNCGASNATGHRFCKRCGAALPVNCPSCSVPNNPDANYCGECGCQLPAAPEERKRVTVLFADIKGSTELIQGQERDPEQVKRILAPVVRIMSGAAERYGGRVDRVPLGDAIMAVFGAPQALEDHAVRACLAALSLQDGVRRWNEAQLRSGNQLEYQVRVGVSSGEIVTSDRQADGPYGEATILASRMEGLAAPGKILLTNSTWRLATGFVRAVSLGPQAVRGKRDMLEVFELEGVAARTRFNARQNQGLTQFVGREAELDLLVRALRRAEAGEGQVVVITGGPGVGKSRLIHHFLHLGAASNATVLETSAEPYDRDSVYLPIANLLRSQLNVLPNDPATAIQEKLETILLPRADLLEAASALLDLPASKSAEWRDLDPVQKRRRIGEAVRELILNARRPSALVVVIEDLQWLDEDTNALVADLIDQVRSLPVLLVLSSREPAKPQGRHCRILHLDALQPLRALELLTHLVGDAPEIEPLRAVVLQRTDNRPTPLFLEETVSSLIEQGVLQGQPGRYHIAGDIEALEREVPHKVEEVLAVRIDRLGREHKKVLETASVIGMEAPLDLLGAVTNLDVERLLANLSELEAADLMYESLSSGQSEFRFKHTLTREAATSRIPHSERMMLHARTVEAIETLYQHRRDEWIDRLADHASRAHLPDKAYGYSAEACRRAIERSANRHAVTFFEKSLSALRSLPDDHDRRRNEIDLRLIALNALLPLGEQDKIGQLLLEAKNLAGSIGDAHRLAKVEVVLTLFLWEAGSHQAALESGAAALQLATQNGLERVSLAARLHIGIVHHALGDFRQTLALHQPVLEELIADGLEKRRFNWAAYPSVITRAFCADSCIGLGDFDQAAAFIREGQALTQEIGHPYSRTMIDTVCGRLHLARDEPAIAAAVFDDAQRRCRDDEVHTMLPAVIAGLGTALARAGRAPEAVRVVQSALDQHTYRKAGNPALYYLLMAIGEAFNAMGDTHRALEMAERAEQLARRHGESAHLAHALHLLGAIHASRDPAAAQRAYIEARDCAVQHYMRPLVAACWQGLAEVQRRLGCADADLTLDKARRLFLELGLPTRAEQALL
jgi:class 3 adenylate cyclase/tetratricopeptide (TPR) repeat protein